MSSSSRTSRPPSRTGSATITTTTTTGHGSLRDRPPSALSTTRSISSYSSATTATATAASTVPKTPKPPSTRLGGLAERDIQKITSSIRTAAKTTGTTTSSTTSANHHHRSRTTSDNHQSANDSFSKEPAPPGSFVAENSSFSRAPLNSRLPPISPHRVTIAKRTNAHATAGPSGSRKTSSKSRQTDDSFEQVDENELLYSSNESPGDEGDEDNEEAELERSIREVRERKREGLDKEPLEGLSGDLQEALIVEDLLFVLMGIEGQYIEYDPEYNPEDEFERAQGAQFVIDSQLDAWIASAVARFLPIATYYTSIHVFVEKYSDLESGAINHALCAAIREILKDYLVLLAQIEHEFMTSPTFTLQKLWFYLHPTLHRLSLLHALTSDLVKLSNPVDDDDDSDSNESSSDDSSLDEGMKGILGDLKGAAAGIRAASWDRRPEGIAKGGEVLAVLSSKLEQMGGDPTARQLYETLLLRASQPYVAILLGWITAGELNDQWDEFIVREDKSISKGSLEMDFTDEYWERRYTLRDKGVKSNVAAGKRIAGEPDAHRALGLAGGAVLPSFLVPYKGKILLAGKFLNVIRECGIEVTLGNEVSLVPGGQAGEELIAMDDEAFFKRIEAAYSYANETLLKLLLEDQDLLHRLKSIKQYFFFEQGNAITFFLDIARHEFAKKKKFARLATLQSLLDFAVRSTTSSSADPYKDDLTVHLHSSTLNNWLVKVNNVDGNIRQRGLDDENDAFEDGLRSTEEKEDPELRTSDAFTFDYRVRFPLNLVISKRLLVRYQLIFRFLLQLKLLERSFLDTWTDHTKQKNWRQRSEFPQAEKFKTRVYAMRLRMLALAQQLFGFAVSEVLEPNWRKLEAKLEKVKTVDQLLRDHVDFLDTSMNNLLLTSDEKTLQNFNRLIRVCFMFNSHCAGFSKALQIATRSSREKGVWDHVSFAKMWDNLSKFEVNFNHHLKQYLEMVSYTATREGADLLPLQVRLSYLQQNQ
ncbi:hypothetical protein T439DRAFT_328325 [Meredithblackwellia eburnea MCA 4105]